jgi:hypothetical protein
MDTATIVVLLIVVAAPVGLVVLLERRDRRARHVDPPAEGDELNVRERARAQQDAEGSRGQAAGMAYGSGIGGNAP